MIEASRRSVYNLMFIEYWKIGAFLYSSERSEEHLVSFEAIFPLSQPDSGQLSLTYLYAFL